MTASSIAAIWLLVLLIFFGIYKTRDIHLNQAKQEMATIEPTAKIALQNRQKLKTLGLYTDRSNSALECLREATQLLPEGEIEFASFNYKKGKGISLRGTASSDNLVYNFFDALTKSPLFVELKDQSINTKTKKGVRKTVFSVTLVLPTTKENS